MSYNKYILNIHPIYHLSRIETHQIPRILYLDLSTGNYNIIKLKQTNTGGVGGSQANLIPVTWRQLVHLGN